MHQEIKLKEILRGLDVYAGSITSELEELLITGISYDSRTVKPGHLFVAIKGQKTDGHKYIEEAKKKGAIAALVEDFTSSHIPQIKVKSTLESLADGAAIFYDNPSERLRVAGVTGSNGKTTSCFLIESIAKAQGLRSGLLGTIDYRWPGHSETSSLTTPMSKDLQNYMAEMVASKCDLAIMEVSSHALEMNRVRKVKFAVGVYTNLSQEHLDFHIDMEHYFRSKEKLFTEHLEPGKPAVINCDDAFGRRLINDLGDHDIWSYGFTNKARVEGEILELTAKGGHLKITTHDCRLDIKTNLIGSHNCYNILGAVATGMALGIPGENIQKGAMSLDRIPGRLEQVVTERPFQVIIDFAHTPDALDNALRTLQSLPHNRIITVFGCGGDRDKTKRPVMGEIAAAKSDHVIVTSDNPRSESPEEIISEIIPGLKNSSTPYIIEADRKRAIEIAISIALPEDIILISGKGHETYQIIGDEVIAFDDREVAKEFL